MKHKPVLSTAKTVRYKSKPGVDNIEIEALTSGYRVEINYKHNISIQPQTRYITTTQKSFACKTLQEVLAVLKEHALNGEDEA